MSGGGGDEGDSGRKPELRGVTSSMLGDRSGRLGRLSPVDAQGTSSVMVRCLLTAAGAGENSVLVGVGCEYACGVRVPAEWELPFVPLGAAGSPLGPGSAASPLR